jgi:hypothetical protein
MTMLAEVVDAVIGIDTHRDTHEVEIADVTGKPVAVMRIGNDSSEFARPLDAIAEVAPGPRVVPAQDGAGGDQPVRSQPCRLEPDQRGRGLRGRPSRAGAGTWHGAARRSRAAARAARRPWRLMTGRAGPAGCTAV